jgi:glycerol-3-phosphate dehydrogenase
MRHIQTDILVIGGGATGTGILRDLAMRGFKSILVEKRDLAYGTTGRYHGLLHSGARYVVKDPLAAKECIIENKILRKIMPQCVEDTGGFFVLTSYDDPTYISQFITGCQKAGIPAEEVSITQMLKEEPILDPKIQLCFQVPDASADSFLASDLNAESARQYGAQVFTYHDVIKITTNSHSNHLIVTAVLCHDLVKDEDVQIDTHMVINASGAWAGKIAKMVGIDIQMLPGKGSMVALNHRIVNTVVNRCKLPSDGDILVPAHTVSVIGTTDIRVSDPDSYSIEPWEIRLMLDEGEKIIPQFKQFRVLRAWAGVRPLIKETYTSNDRDISRAYTLIDHLDRDGIDGFITITSGKWTTYRKMAEATVDKVCEKLKVSRACRTHLEILPSKNDINKAAHYLGARLESVEVDSTYGRLICECELATWDEVEQAIIHSDVRTLDDIRRDVRLGMGPCQGAFCTLRVAGMMHELRHPPVRETNASLRDFLEERWKGNLPILWGQQLRQERLNELIYLNNLNVNNLPGNSRSKLYNEAYKKPTELQVEQRLQNSRVPSIPTILNRSQHVDVIVIGAGLSGLIAAWRACQGGLKTKIISKGWGANYWSTGCIDILGNLPPDFTGRSNSPANQLLDLIKKYPDHPYSIIGLELLEKAISSFLNLMDELKYPFNGSLDRNLLLPTALGTIHPTCLAPLSMIAGDLNQSTPILIVGFTEFYDFPSVLIADNLSTQGFLTHAITLDLKTLRNRKFLSGMVLARLFDNPEFRQEVIDNLKPKLGNVGRIGFPAILGVVNTIEVMKHLESSLGVPVFEISGLPPSIPGIRLHNMLISAIENHHGEICNGMQVSGAQFENNKVTSIISEAAARHIAHTANHFILATGGILGGGIATSEHGYAQESIFNIPIHISQNRSNWFQDQFISNESHPIHTKGLRVDSYLHPVNEFNQVFYQNLFAVGNTLGNYDPIREGSMEGVAIASGYKVGESLSNGSLH